MDKLINIQTEAPQVLIGNHLHFLDDISSSIFKTNSLHQLRSYLDGADVQIFHTEDKVQAFNSGPNDKSNLREVVYGEAPVAECTLQKTAVAKMLLDVNNRKLSIKDFQYILRKLKQYLDGADSVQLKGLIDNYSMKKVVSVEGKKDNRGNLLHKIQVEGAGAGKNDVEFPEKIKFKFPFYRNSNSTITIVFELIFDWDATSDGSVNMFFTMLCFEIEERVEDFVEAFFNDAFKDTKHSRFTGELHIISKTNRDLIFKNELKIDTAKGY